MDVTKTNDTNPVARQLRYSLLNYMSTDCFQPNISVYPEEMRALLFDTQVMKKFGASALINGAPAVAAIDGDPNTFVVAGDPQAQLREQPELVITFREPVTISGVVLMPRQNHREHEGAIREYIISASENGSNWYDVVRGEMAATFAPHKAELTKPISTKYLKLISISGFGADKMTSLAELAVIEAVPKSNADTKRRLPLNSDQRRLPIQRPRPSPSPTPRKP